jgi:hypothetical protein
LCRQQLGHYEKRDTAIETHSGVRETHQPDRRDALVELQADLTDSPMLHWLVLRPDDRLCSGGTAEERAN